MTDASREVVTKCSVDGCEKPARNRGWCSAHYQRWRRNGDPGPAGDGRRVPKAKPPLPRLLASLTVGGRRPDGSRCLEWSAAVGGDGYGRFSVNGRLMLTHRFAYEHWIGPIPEGLQIDHLCRNRACANPVHLEAVTQRENLLRGEGPAAIQARKTHCQAGHEFTPENTYLHPQGGRVCIACRHIKRGVRKPRGPRKQAT